jgi:hypothetical protein
MHVLLEDEAADLAQIIIIGADIPPTDLGNRVAIAFVDNTQKHVVSSPEKLGAGVRHYLGGDQNSAWQAQQNKTYSSRDSHVVTHRSTNLPFNCLCMAERTGCPVFS